MPKPGENISHYRIVSAIGAGGMGEVYLAQDTKLDRKVALKVLPEDVVANAERLRRFEQEARAASALNHPNILTIYEIGEVNGKNYISTEYVDGKTLRDIMRSDSLTLHQAIDIAAQTASALSAAHEARIIHRDIKPENIMVRPDGLVKVLDFGLAKLSEPGAVATGSEDATRAQVKTAPGVIMGTVQYMSPEQTRGRATDARSDIWSLGCVMYEMLSGRGPFAGETTADLIAEIVKGYPLPLAQIVPEIPERLEEIISKTLEKEPDERYQSVKDMLIDLRRLKKKLDLDVEIDRSHAPTSDQISDPHNIATQAMKATASDTIAGQTTISGAEAVTSTIRRHKLGAAAVFAAGAIVLAGFGYGLYRFLEKSAPPQQRTNAEMKAQRLTGDGKTRAAEISPDGKFLAYLRTEGGERSIWIKQIQTNSSIQIVKPGELDGFNRLVFSPDGNFLYFNARSETAQEPSIYRVPSLGGTPTKAFTNANGIEFSPDGRQVSFGRFDLATLESSVIVANADGSGERKLATRTGKQFFGATGVWSPDGKTIAIALGDDALAPDPAVSVILIPVAGGEATQLGASRWVNVDDLVWHPSGDSIIATAIDNTFAQSQLWEISYSSGAVRRLTNNLNGYLSVSITANGKSLVTGEVYARSAVWVSPDLKPENAKQVMPATGDTWGLSWTPDGRIVYVSDQTGEAEVWIMDADGGNAKPLTNDKIFKTTPVVSPDGRFIVYTSNSSGGQLIRIDANGGNPQILVTGIGADNPDISADGKWIIYSAWIEGMSRILRIPIEGGLSQTLTEYPAIEPRYSRDGTRFACFVANEKSQDWERLAIVPAEGGPPTKFFDVPRNVNIGRGPIWTPDDSGITLVVAPGELQNLWLQPVKGGEGKAMTNFQLPGVARREYSRDGKRIALVRAEGSGNAVMITDYR
jgi:eukaryotic-like serine/threonine-protein kinase